MTATVMLIHGAWLSPLGFEKFRARYEALGHEVVAPAWPYDDRPVEELRRSPDPRLAKVGIREIVDHYDAEIRKLTRPPILIGHSFGGLFVQLLLDRGLGAAGVAIDPAPARGVMPRPQAMMASMPVMLSWNGWNRVLTMSYASFRRSFANTLPEAEARASYDRYIIPTPGRPYFQVSFGIETRIHWKNPTRPPLMLIVADEDKTITPGMVRATYRKQRRSPSVTELKTFPHRSHFLILEGGWEEVADYAVGWARYPSSHHGSEADRPFRP
jgi:pimeloyl-ACP methyl ester carboxylesterase